MSNAASPEVPLWIRTWTLVSSLVVIWDFGYCLLRPLSMEGGSLNFLWKPYNLYAKELKVQQDPKKKHHVTIPLTYKNTAFMNGIETLLNFTYLGLLKSGQVNVGQANLVGFSAALMTLSKTVLYWLIEPFSGYQHIGHNSLKDLIILWIIPNGLWIVVPAAIVYTLGKDLNHRLDVNSKQD
ncbi:conserved hypothetical protein [Mucor ambiguus]|uniref:Uncharacterized protein n=1 Tax=Mucor ambiguus TaxID=91626 RepID=A0A0C9MEA4_9FUNG|nr:conserved hypothetical protein [Mucor ambiguus]